MEALRIHPDRAEFERLAARWPLVPAWTELSADVSTPVGVFPSLARDGAGVLLESVERSERWGRYSFVAGDPAAVVSIDMHPGRVVLFGLRPEGRRMRIIEETVKELQEIGGEHEVGFGRL